MGRRRRPRRPCLSARHSRGAHRAVCDGPAPAHICPERQFYLPLIEAIARRVLPGIVQMRGTRVGVATIGPRGQATSSSVRTCTSRCPRFRRYSAAPDESASLWAHTTATRRGMWRGETVETVERDTCLRSGSWAGWADLNGHLLTWTPEQRRGPGPYHGHGCGHGLR